MTRILLSISLLALGGCGSSAASPDGPAVAPDAALTDGAPGPPPVLKFCNALYAAGNKSVTLTLVIGNPPVSFTAASGNCDPPPPAACRTISSGSAVSTVLLDSGGTQLASGPLPYDRGVEYIFFSAIGASGAPTIQGGPVKAGLQCATIDPYPHDAGATD
jgi:hypothetical protein